MNTTDQITLDVSDIKKKGNDLHLLINNAVKDYGTNTLPNVLILSEKQFSSLSGSLEEMMDTGVFMFQTPFNVMEVEIKGE